MLEQRSDRSRLFCSLAVAVLASCYSSSALGRDLAVLDDGSAKLVSITAGRSCHPHTSMNLEVERADFFDARRADLGELFGHALQAELKRCPSLKRVILYGMVENRKFLEASSVAEENWQLRLGPSKLENVANYLDAQVKGFANLPQLEIKFKPFAQIPGIAGTNGYRLYALKSQEIIEALVQDDNKFVSYAKRLAKNSDQTDAQRSLDQTLTILSYYNPSKAQEYRAAYTDILKEYETARLNSSVTSALNDTNEVSNALATLTSVIDTRPPEPSTIADADEKISAWVDARLAQHEATYSTGALNDISAHQQLLESLSEVQVSSKLPETNATLEASLFWLEVTVEDFLIDAVFSAQSILDESGEEFFDVDLVFETALLLSEEFEEAGFFEQSETVSEYATARIDFLINTGLEAYSEFINSKPMTLDRVAELNEELDSFFLLSKTYPGFTKYVEIIEAAISDGQQDFCRAQASTLTSTDPETIRLGVGGSHLTLQEFSCDLYRNGHLVTSFDAEQTEGIATITVEDASSGALSFALQSSESDNAYISTDPDWEAEITRLGRQPAHGRPNQDGATECDLLVGDPADGTLPAPGVRLDALPDTYDYDRATDACIAAVEHAPDDPRQIYQLARLLEHLGENESTSEYLDVAVELGFGPAFHLKAMSVLTTSSDETAYFDAIDLLKEAAAWGYAPSMFELTELIPADTDIFREIPWPSDEEILNAFGPDICEDESMIRSCIYFQNVTQKNCFQIAAKEFSCEIRMAYECEVLSRGGNAIGNFFANGLGGVGGMNQRNCKGLQETDPLFVTMKKGREGNWSYKRDL